MKLLSTTFVFALFFVFFSAKATNGLIILQSQQSAKSTMNKFELLAKNKGLTIFARIDHAAGAKKVGQQLGYTEVIIFGNPQGGTPLMQCAQTMGIDLPLKALVWQDANAKVWLSYNDPSYLTKRHGAGQCAVATKLANVLAELAAQALQP